jgi:DNA polymerase III delta prime subunit
MAEMQEHTERHLSAEQERILGETERNQRQLFIGAAGTGKTFLAQAKARQLSAEGKKIFVTWFNKMERNLYADVAKLPHLTARPFLEFLLEDMAYRGKSLEEPDSASERQAFYQHILVNNAADVYEGLPVEERFDAVIVDEGQEFRAHWYGCLAAMLKPDGQMYVFADPEQNFFADGEPGLITRLPASEHRLTENFRNARVINEFVGTLRKQPATTMVEADMQQLLLRPWQVSVDQPAMIERDLIALKRQGLDLSRVLLLGPDRLAKSSLANIHTLAGLPVRENPITGEPAIRYSAIRSFKGLEADVVFVIDVRPDSPHLGPTDLYVAASRAKYVLGVFHRVDWQLAASGSAT